MGYGNLLAMVLNDTKKGNLIQYYSIQNQYHLAKII